MFWGIVESRFRRWAEAIDAFLTISGGDGGCIMTEAATECTVALIAFRGTPTQCPAFGKLSRQSSSIT